MSAARIVSYRRSLIAGTRCNRSKKSDYLYVCGFAGTGALGIRRNCLLSRSGIDDQNSKYRLKALHIKTPKIVVWCRVVKCSPAKILSIACGAGFSILLQKNSSRNTSSNLYGFGLNANGQIGYKEESSINPKFIIDPRKITYYLNDVHKSVQCAFVKISAGRSHSLCLDEKGNVFALGCNRFGQCNDVEKAPRDFFLEIGPIDSICCGSDHSVLVNRDGQVFSFGLNDKGQLGHSSNNLYALEGDIKSKRILKVASRGSFNLALDDNGNVYGWGDNTFAQLQVSSMKELLSEHRVVKPVCLNIPFPVKDIAVSHSCAVLLSNEHKQKLYSWGMWRWDERFPNQSSIDNHLKEVHLHTHAGTFEMSGQGFLRSGHNSFAYVDKGVAFLWGCNKHFNLPVVRSAAKHATGNPNNPPRFISKPERMNVAMNVNDIGLGYDHSIAIVSALA